MKLSDVLKSELKKSKYILGLSGGVDSMVLLDLLVKENLVNRVEIVHINHGLRKESEEEESGIIEYTSKLGLREKTHIHRLNLSVGGGSFEAEARDARYKIFKDEAVRLGCSGILTGHHGEDLVETILMRLVRGSGSRGLIGMSEFNYDRELGLNKIAGLYGYKKREIYAYAKENNILYYEDYTNKDNSITRNNLRNNVLPVLEELNENYIKSFERFSEYMKQDKEYWGFKYRESKEKVINKYHFNGFSLNTEKLASFHELEVNNLVYNLLVEIIGEKKVESKHVVIIKELINNENNTDALTLTKNVKAFKHGGKLVLFDDSFIGESNAPKNMKKIENKKNERFKGKRISKILSEMKIPICFRNEEIWTNQEDLYIFKNENYIKADLLSCE